MKKHWTLCIAALSACACTQKKVEDVIIPQPVQIEYLGGWTKSNASVQIDTTEALGAESYRMQIQKGKIEISAGDGAGAFYALQSLEQLKRHYGKRIPCQFITDSPRFPYRGVHLDVSRNFRDKDFVKKQLLIFSKLKINRFHFHLVDGAGWRIQIMRYPELTQRAAWRTHEYFTDWRKGGSKFSCEGADDAFGGYYTQDDIREIVAYADSLHITVIPEIEMFGHSSEVTHVYPTLACKDEAGSDVYCIGKEETFEFLENVLAEVIDLFPSEYIHIGGDEANKKHWRECPDCQARIRKEHLANVDELQSYGIARIEKFVNSKGRKIIGWDEILEGGLAPNAAVMSWQGVQGGQKAAAMHHYAVMTPGEFCYLDKCQDDPSIEPPAFGGNLSLEKIYSYDPAPDGMPGKEYIIGVQGNLWTEYVPTAEHAEHMLYPRVYAIAEIGWTSTDRLEYTGFRQRALEFNANAIEDGYHPFDLAHEKGCRDGYNECIDHLAKGCPVTYLTEYFDGYKADGPQSMCDGLVGGWDYRDRWMGWLSKDASFIVDLGQTKSISSAQISFGQWRSAEIMIPSAVTFEASTDGETFKLLDRIETELDYDYLPPIFQDYCWKGEATECRYLKVTGHINPSNWGWLFADELIVL